MTALEQETMDSRMTALEEENRLLREKNAVLEVWLDGLQNAFLGLGKRVAEIEVFKNEKGKRIKGCEDAIAALRLTSNAYFDSAPQRTPSQGRYKSLEGLQRSFRRPSKEL